MFVGTGSDVGKSVLNAAFCRIFKQDGYNPAPFKAQNMSLNSYATPEGLEIGRAQAMQAEAAGIPCHTDMNPVLLKPTSQNSAQVILNGKPLGNESAYAYFRDNKESLFQEAMQAYQRLHVRYNPVVIEGAGSISELNLKDRDIVNMRVAKETKAATILVGDIDRGGIFASIYGSLELLPADERKCIKGIIINKFRGDARLFESGRHQLETITGLPVLGVIPAFTDIQLDEEDSVAMEKRNTRAVSDKINICVIWLRHLSNFTDFEIFENHNSLNLYYSESLAEIEKSDMIIIPGSKNTIDDLEILKQKGIDQAIFKAYQNNKPVYGICGGYQMMGQTIEDPMHMESNTVKVRGLGLLPIRTRLQGNKTTRQCNFRFRNNKSICTGYEIHMGKTLPITKSNALNTTTDDEADGYFLNDRCWGTYIHGIFNNEPVLEHIFSNFTGSRHEISRINMANKEIEYDKLANVVRNHLDLHQIYKMLNV